MSRTIAMLARSYDGVIGVDNNIPWHCKEDLQAFKDMTLRANVVVMGRKTWESIPNGLPGRNVCVLSSQEIPGVMTFTSVEEFQDYRNEHGLDFCVIAGGASVYEAFLAAGVVDDVLETVIPMEIGTVENAVRLTPDYAETLHQNYDFLGSSTLPTEKFGNVVIDHYSKG